MKNLKKVLAFTLVIALLLAGCSVTNSNNGGKQTLPPTPDGSKPNLKPEEAPVITLYPKDGNLFSGVVTGSRAEYFAAEGGFQLEVWSYSEDKTNAMLVSGELPDIMYLGAGDTEMLQTLIETGKIINYEDYKAYLPNYFENPYSEYVPSVIEDIRKNYSAGTNGLYVLPMGIGETAGVYTQLNAFDRVLPKLKWDTYEAIGAPEITDWYQLLDVVEQMLEYEPTAADGTKMYGTYLDNGMDTDRWGGMYLWMMWNGCDPTNYKYFTEQNRITGTVESIFDDDSVYKAGLKWYNEMYRRGLLDPDSISTARGDQAPKVDNGLCMLPSGTLPGWADKYFEVYVPGMSFYRNFTNVTMANVQNCIVINAETEHLAECLAFVNMMADPYALLNINYGPEGDIWEADGTTLKLTEEFKTYLKENGSINNFPMSDGTQWSTWNTPNACAPGVEIPGYTDVDGNPLCFTVTSWKETQDITNVSENFDSWKEIMDAEDVWDYVTKNDITVYQGDVFAGAVLPEPDDLQKLTIASIKDIVVAASWNCVYAKSEAEFEQIWDKMVSDAMGLGAADIISWMQENYVPTKDISSTATKPTK